MQTIHTSLSTVAYLWMLLGLLMFIYTVLGVCGAATGQGVQEGQAGGRR